MNNDFAAIILAAGLGKRMKSDMPKVLHHIAGKTMLSHTVDLLNKVRPRQIIIVVNPKNIAKIKESIGTNQLYAIQESPLGTADAAKAGLKIVDLQIKTVCVMYGDDSAFYKPETIANVFKTHQGSGAKITFVTLKKDNPSGLGRIMRKNGKLMGIIEEKDATESQKRIKEVNNGLYFFEKDWLQENLTKIKVSKITGEMYLTDLIAIALKTNQKVETYMLRDTSQWHGINTPEELAAANQKLIIPNSIHVMGAAGAGAAAICGIAKAYGYRVTGCDLNPSSAYLGQLDLSIRKGHDPSHLKESQMLVVSPAVLKLNPRNPELIAAKKLKMPILTWQEFQGKFLQKDKFVIAVAGAYGKSTTTAMISQVLIDAGLDPTCEIGAKVLEWDSNFRVGKSQYYVCEADEYNNNFLSFEPDIALILNIGWDHPDFFKSEQSVLKAYRRFVGKIKKGGTLVMPNSIQIQDLIAASRKDIKVAKIEDFGKINLSIIGDFRKENAKAALTVAKVLGLDPKIAKKSLENFKGTGRRLEFKGEVDDVKVYDDYAVQPFTVKVTADALKDRFKDQKVVLVFEPHTFTRIKTFFKDFVDSLLNTKVDRVLITNAYAARERGDPGGLSIKLAKSIGRKAKYTGSLEQTVNYLKSHLKDFDIILSMGAGDVYKLYSLLKGF